MTQTITELLGTSAALSGGTLTVQLADLKDSNNAALLATPTSATASQAVAALLSHLHRVTTQAVDGNGVAIVDKTDAIVSSASFQPKTFEVRDGESQIRNEFTFLVYTTDNNTFDPDDAI